MNLRSEKEMHTVFSAYGNIIFLRKYPILYDNRC